MESHLLQNFQFGEFHAQLYTVLGVYERLNEEFVGNFPVERVNAFQSHCEQFVIFLVTHLGEQIEEQSLINEVYVEGEVGPFEQQTQRFDRSNFERLMQILQKVVKEHNYGLLNVEWEVSQSSHFRPKVRKCSAVVCRVGRTQQSQIFFFDFAVPILEKVVCDILMEAVQPMYIKVCEFVLQHFHLALNCLFVILKIRISGFDGLL
jgi:hypothetical protein